MIKNRSICKFANSDASIGTERLSARTDMPAARPDLTFYVLVCLAAFALATGLATLVGWWAKVPRLTDWIGHGISMFPNTAVAGACTGVALLLVTFRNRACFLIAGCLAIFVAALGAETKVESAKGKV